VDDPVGAVIALIKLQGGIPLKRRSLFGMRLSRPTAALAVLAGVIVAIAGLAQGAGSQEIPASQHTLDLGETHSWVVHDSAGTEVYPPANNGAPDKHGLIRWEPGGKYAGAQKTYMVLGFRVASGSPGRMFDGHTTPADDPYGWSPPAWPGGPPACCAPFAIDYFKGSGRGLEYVAEPNQYRSGSRAYHFRILTEQEMGARVGQWVWLWVEVTWGRRNLPVQGAARIWVAGEDTPRVNVSNINTHWPEEGMVSFWTGSYWTDGAPARSVADVAAPRFGRTPQEAYEDAPSVYSRWGDGTSVALASGAPAVPAIPTPLRWGTPSSPPPPAPADTTAPSQPGGLTVTGASATSVSLSWSASTDNVGVTGYGVYRNGTLFALTAQRAMTVSDLACGATVTVAVDAYDAAGNRSDKATITTSALSGRRRVGRCR
jgi:Fibronectin type III domain